MKELLAKLALLEKRAADKLAEIKDDTAVDAARAIENEHEGILAEIAEVRAQVDIAKATETRGVEPVAAPRIDVAAAVRKAQDDERRRMSEIRKLAKEGSEVELGDDHIDTGSSVEQFRTALLEKMLKREAPAVDNRSPARVGEEHVEKRAAVIEAVILHRANPRNELPAGAGEFRGMSLIDLARESLEANGVRTRGMSRMEIATEALAQRASGMHTTSDFPAILGNTVNRTLRSAYEAAPQTFRPLVHETTVSDFKDVTRVQLGEAPQLERVNEHGEYKRGTLAEGTEKYRVYKYGKIVGITREALINDDLGAFTRLAQQFGVAAANLESDLVWAEILSNPTMGDSVALFHATHKNLGPAAAMSEVTIAAMRAAMAKQTGVDKKTVLSLRPSFLIVPVDLENAAEKLIATNYTPSSTNNAVAPSIRSLTPISEPRLDNGLVHPVTGATIAGSSTAHYLAASPASTDTVELAYLEGTRGVYTEMRPQFTSDGMEIKVRMEAGAKVIDWRAFQKNAGA